MGLLSFLTSAKAVKNGVFSFFWGTDYPSPKARAFQDSYGSWIYACVSAISDEVATIELKFQKRASDGWQDVSSHPALNLPRYINPRMSSDELFAATQSYLELDGNAFWYVSYHGKGVPAE